MSYLAKSGLCERVRRPLKAIPIEARRLFADRMVEAIDLDREERKAQSGRAQGTQQRKSSITSLLLLQPASSRPPRIRARVAAEVPTGTSLARASPLGDVSPRARLAVASLRAVSPRTEPPTPSRRLSGPTSPSLGPTLVKNYLRNHISKNHVTKTIQRKSLLPIYQSSVSQSSPRTTTPTPLRSSVFIPKPLPDVPVGGRLSLFEKKWGEVCEDSHALEAVRHRVSFSFLDRPPLLPEPVFSVRSDKRHAEILFHVEDMQDGYPAVRLGHLNRPQGCLFPYSHQASVP